MLFKTFYKNDCVSIRKRFSEYLDGALSEEERMMVHDHLGSCEECSDQLDELCKTLSVLVDFREECLPESIQDFRLPRSTFVQIFPSIEQERVPWTLSVFVPYVYALILFFLVLSTWEFAYRHTYVELYNASNWVEVVAKM